ncbi:MAG: ThuA domain-containing protein [Isosphaeraceae bacterium]
MGKVRMLARSLAMTTTVLALVGGPGTPAAHAQKKAPQGAKVLLLTGGQRQHHGYRDQAFYLASALEDTGRYEVTIDEDAAVLETPAMNKYDLIIVNADRRDPEFKFTASQQEALLAWVKAGHGYVSIHGADNSAADWVPAWRDMLGGVFTHVGLPDGKVRKGTYAVKIVEKNHPVTRGLSDFELKDELYYNMQMKPDVKPLATTEFGGGVWPVAWTREFGKARVFHTPLGHRDFGPGKDDPLRDPNLFKLVLQGIDWVAEGSKAKP